MKYLVAAAMVFALSACSRPPPTEAELARGNELIQEWREHCQTEYLKCSNALIVFKDGAILRLTAGQPGRGETGFGYMEQWAVQPLLIDEVVNIVRPDETEEYNALAGQYLRRL